MAQFAALICATDSAHDPGQEGPAKDECDDHADALAAQGTMTAAWALTPRAAARSIRATDVTDGPFLESQEVVAGFYILEAPNLDVALAVARQNPVIAAGGGVEVRPVHSGGWVQQPEP